MTTQAQQLKIGSDTLDNIFWGKYFGVYDVLNMVMPYQDLLKEICNEAEARSLYRGAPLLIPYGTAWNSMRGLSMKILSEGFEPAEGSGI